MVRFEADDLLGDPITADYIPMGIANPMFMFTRNRPIFSWWAIREMLQDPRIIFGLWLIKGPIVSNARFHVASQNEEVRQFVMKQLTRFWRNSAVKALKSLEWGYSGSEVLYRMESDGLIHFNIIKDLYSPDLRAVTDRGTFAGMTVRNVPIPGKGKVKIFLGGPKVLWHVHHRERHPWYGLSRLYGAHVPWWEKWSDGGYRDIRRLWFHKNAFEGGVIYHPPGSQRDTQGNVISNKDYAREMIEKKQTGGVLTLPNAVTGPGGDQRSWEYQPPQGNTIPAGLLEYGDTLDTETLEAMGIPSEVVQSGGEQGFGSASGRTVPQMAFYSVLQEMLQWLVSDFDEQCLQHLVHLNYGTGMDAEYEIVPFPLTRTIEEDPVNQSMDPEPQFSTDVPGGGQMPANSAPAMTGEVAPTQPPTPAPAVRRNGSSKSKKASSK